MPIRNFLLASMAILLSVILSACGGSGGSNGSDTTPTPEPEEPTLVSIQVSPAQDASSDGAGVSVKVGDRLQFTAQGSYSDGSTADITDSVDWSSDATAIASVDSQGNVTAVSAGKAAVSASQDGITSNTVMVTVPLERVRVVTLGFEAVKRFRFGWTDVAGASRYRLMENPDGFSGFSPVGEEVAQGTETLALEVPLYARANAQYMLRACTGQGAREVCSDTGILSVSDTLVDSIGYFKATNTDANDEFGSSVSLSADGNTLAVGAAYEESNFTGIDQGQIDQGQSDNSAADSGAVYIFSRSAGSWTWEAYIKASNTDPVDRFGTSVSLSADGNTLAVGAPGEESSATGVDSNGQSNNDYLVSGAVYTFTRDENGWDQQAYIKPGNTEEYMGFGRSVSLSADSSTLAVGARGESNNATGVDNQDPHNTGATDSGAVYVFVQEDGTWKEDAYIKASNTGSNDLFGTAVSLSGDGNTLAVGAISEDSSATGVHNTSSANGGNQLDNSVSGAGAVYMFSRHANAEWTQDAYIKASNTGQGDEFGAAVSLSADGNTLAVGARQEDSSTTGTSTGGIAGDGDNNDADEAGAVYVFSRTGTGWQQQAYVKADDTNGGDGFGWTVSLNADGNTLAVGARHESSAATGINGDQDFEPGDDGFRSGATYVFTRNAGSWFQKAYVKSSNSEQLDAFGEAVSLSGDGNTLAVGAKLENGSATGIGGNQNNLNTANSGAVYVY
ncbi:Ig-like domain-containing protein [Microbulbifer sp. 2201CG32-9]|uniref:Ig-like domain-containing protein n=1 Tax=Microbulbifer sp. 2201CG32-9 TaxID=3232309 RepID=UPI00345C4FAF